MHLFSRVCSLTGGAVRPLDWATRMTERVNALMQVEVALWTSAFGNPLGTVAWSAQFESRAHLVEEMGKSAGDDGYAALADEGQEFISGGLTDTLRTMVHTTSAPTGPPPVGAWAEIITAVPAEGKIAASMAWGVEISDAYAAVTGTPVAFLADDYGPFGQLTWISVHEDAAAADAAGAATMADAGYLEKVDGGGGLFVPGHASRMATVRVA